MGKGGAARGFSGLCKYTLGMVVLVVTLFLLFKVPRYLSVPVQDAFRIASSKRICRSTQRAGKQHAADKVSLLFASLLSALPGGSRSGSSSA